MCEIEHAAAFFFREEKKCLSDVKTQVFFKIFFHSSRYKLLVLVKCLLCLCVHLIVYTSSR